LDIAGLNLFIKVCDIGFYEACDELGLDYERGKNNLEELEKSLGFRLFEYNEHDPIGSMTNKGELFLPKAKEFVGNLIDCALLDSDSDSDSDWKGIIIRASPLNGKNFILPFLEEIDWQKECSRSFVDFYTYEDYSDEEFVNAHILFCNMTKADKIFFDKKWSVEMEQGLYASEEYLKDVNMIPKTPEDLASHSVIGYGDSFDKEIYKSLNWHLSGEYGIESFEPSIIVNSQSVLMKMVEFDFGIGPVLDYHNKISEKKLVRVLPDIKGPVKTIDFAIRRSIPNRFKALVDDIENKILNAVLDLELKVLPN
jgi:DNA-binding transcriptional LysR family regulator